MNCKACLKVIGEYIDGELAERSARLVAVHLESCSACANAYEKIQYEQTVYAALGQHFELNHPQWETVQSRIHADKNIRLAASFTPARRWFPNIRVATSVAAVVLVSIASVLLVATLLNQTATSDIPSQRAEIGSVPAVRATGSDTFPGVPTDRVSSVVRENIPASARTKSRPGIVPAERKLIVAQRSETPSFDVEKFGDPQAMTLDHIEKSEMLLRSFRNAPEDVAFEKGRFQKLLRRNVLLRCEAIVKGNLPEEEVLKSLEPILIDITNLPDRASPEDLRSIAETIRKTEIVAMLQVYSQTNNR